MKKRSDLKIIIVDIETSPLITYTWGLFDQNIGLNQVKEEWFILSWAAKYYKAPDGTVYGPHDKVMYMDQKDNKVIHDDKKLLEGIWNLLNEVDIIIGHNARNFDVKKLNAKFLLAGLKPPTKYRVIDTLTVAKRNFNMTSNKLEFLSNKLCVKYKKLKHKKYPGFELWKECMAGNKDAWKEMRKYNIYDILSLEELFHKLSPWDNSINFNVYSDDLSNVCRCGSKDFKKKGYAYSNAGKYQRYICKTCGAQHNGKVNLLSKEKRKALGEF